MDQKDRILWVDFTKAIVMVLIIIGHSSIPKVLQGAIYSFHMPLLFLLSGYTTKCSESMQQVFQRIKKTAKSLIITAYLLWIIRRIIYLLIGRSNYSLLQIILSAIWAGGETYNIAGIDIPAMGMTWFLVTLFMLRNAYNILHYLTNGLHMTHISICAAILGMIIGQWVQLPFSLDLALVSFVFFHCGQFLRRRCIQTSAAKCGVAAILWGGVLLAEYIICNTYLGMTSRRYPVFCIMCALAGCLLCIYICQFLCEFMPNCLAQPIYAIGQYSLLLFAIHYLDGIWYPFVSNHTNACLSLIIRLLVDICLLFALILLRRCYQRRRGYLNNAAE